MGINLNTDGILSNKTDMSGNNCQVLGDLQCENEQMPACSGMGFIDCTDDCPGTEEEFKHFREIMEDPDFPTKYPKIAEMAKKNDSEEHKTDKEPKMEELKPDHRKMFLKSLTKCKTFSQETLALLQLVEGGMKFGSVSSDPNDLTYVAPGALSNISQIEYDYSDYYEDYEEVEDGEESTKKRRAVQETTTALNKTALASTTVQSKIKKPIKFKDTMEEKR